MGWCTQISAYDPKRTLLDSHAMPLVTADNPKNYSAEIQHPAEDHPILRLSPTAWNLRQGQPFASTNATKSTNWIAWVMRHSNRNRSDIAITPASGDG
jgi:hypothetical protein